MWVPKDRIFLTNILNSNKDFCSEKKGMNTCKIIFTLQNLPISSIVLDIFILIQHIKSPNYSFHIHCRDTFLN